jgi:hypothetical protein
LAAGAFTALAAGFPAGFAAEAAFVGGAAFRFAATALSGLAATFVEALARGATVFAVALALAEEAAFFDGSPVVLGVAGFGDAFEAFAFTTTPFSAWAATMVFATVGPSCRGEGDRR